MDHRMVSGWKRYVSVHPSIALYLFAVSMSGNILTQLVEQRICTVTLGINETECTLLEQDNNGSAELLRIDALVQPLTSLILSSKSFVDSVIPACLSLLLGAWSDRYGRKPLLLAGYTGASLTFVTLSLLAAWETSPWLLLIAYIPSGCSGGLCAIILACVCYINDTTGQEERASQLACLGIVLSVGVLFGTLAGPALFRAYGYVPVFGVAASSCLLGTLYVKYFVTETITVTSENGGRRSWRTLLDTNLVKDLVNACTKKRDGFDRCKAWCCIASLVILVMNLEGEVTIGYLFANARLGWDVNRYSVCVAIGMAASICGTIIGAIILRTATGISEVLTAIVALLSSAAGSLIRAFVMKPWQMYLSIGVGSFSDVAAPSIRAILSKSVPSQNIGRIFSLTTSIEVLMPFAASSLYSAVYSCTMPPMYPAVVWLVSAALSLLALILVAMVSLRNVRAGIGGCYRRGSISEECGTESLLSDGESSIKS